MTIWKAVISHEQLVGRLETSSFDFKREYELLAPGTPVEMAKDVAAFASGYGGTVLVGVEQKDRAVTDVPGVPDPQKLIEVLRKAVAAYCAPWPPYAEEALVIDAAAAEAIMGVTPSLPYQARVVVAINVDADPRGPIGVRPIGGKGTPIAQAFTFPVRVGDATQWLGPTELPMWMNSHERRVAIRLRRLLGESGSDVDVCVFHLPPGQDQTRPVEQAMKLASVDESTTVVRFSGRSNAGGAPVDVPLSFVSDVWQDAASRAWIISVRGALYVDRHAFRPLGGV